MAAVKLPILYRYEDLKDFIGLLSGVSGMVFTLMGIWIAFLYPNALSRLANPSKIEMADFSETREDTKRLEKIVASVLKSAIVLTALLFFSAAKILLSSSDTYLGHTLQFKSAALSMIVVLSCLQLEAVASVIIANVMFINDLHRKRRDIQSEEDA